MDTPVKNQNRSSTSNVSERNQDQTNDRSGNSIDKKEDRSFMPKFDNIASQAHQTIDKTTEAASPFVQQLSSTAHSTVDKVAGMVSTASEKVGERTDQLKGYETQLMQKSNQYIRENPLAAVGIALATGFILSRLLSR
ncbi:MAG: DUF883 C-terminal domain-containing protein [Pseudomonadota bacterium]